MGVWYKGGEICLFNDMEYLTTPLNSQDDYFRSVARIFQKGGGGGHTMSKIVMSTSMSCFTLCDKNDLQEGGQGHPRDHPSYTLVLILL